MTLQEELKKAEQELVKKQEELKAKFATLAAFEPFTQGYEPAFVHVHKLYGTVGSIQFKPAYSEILAKGKAPDAALLNTLLKQFPPLPAVLVADGCKSFRPDEKAIGRAEEWKGDVSEVYGVQVDIEPASFHSTEVGFKWYAMVNGEPWRIEVQFPEHRTRIGSLSIRYDRYKDGEIKSVIACNFSPADPNAQYIKWASGSHKEPNHFTVYWDTDSGKATNFADYIK